MWAAHDFPYIMQSLYFFNDEKVMKKSTAVIVTLNFTFGGYSFQVSTTCIFSKILEFHQLGFIFIDLASFLSIW